MHHVNITIIFHYKSQQLFHTEIESNGENKDLIFHHIVAEFVCFSFSPNLSLLCKKRKTKQNKKWKIGVNESNIICSRYAVCRWFNSFFFCFYGFTECETDADKRTDWEWWFVSVDFCLYVYWMCRDYIINCNDKKLLTCDV